MIEFKLFLENNRNIENTINVLFTSGMDVHDIAYIFDDILDFSIFTNIQDYYFAIKLAIDNVDDIYSNIILVEGFAYYSINLNKDIKYNNNLTVKFLNFAWEKVNPSDKYYYLSGLIKETLNTTFSIPNSPNKFHLEKLSEIIVNNHKDCDIPKISNVNIQTLSPNSWIQILSDVVRLNRLSNDESVKFKKLIKILANMLYSKFNR